jgi:hypothetical protein
MKKYLLLLALITVLISSCSEVKPPNVYQFSKSQIINHSFDDTWTKIINWFAENNIPIKTIEKASGIIATEKTFTTKGYEEYCDCGSPETDLSGYTYAYEDIISNINITVVKINDNSCNVKINIFYKAKKNAYSTNSKTYQKVFVRTMDIIDCNSTGKYENKLFNSLK